MRGKPEPPIITASDYQCDICHDLLVDPVVGACGHDFCKHCLEIWQTHQRGDLTCPVCRARLGAGHNSLAVCQRLKSMLEKYFPHKTNKRRHEIEEERENETESPRKRLCNHDVDAAHIPPSPGFHTLQYSRGQTSANSYAIQTPFRIVGRTSTNASTSSPTRPTCIRLQPGSYLLGGRPRSPWQNPAEDRQLRLECVTRMVHLVVSLSGMQTRVPRQLVCHAEALLYRRAASRDEYVNWPSLPARFNYAVAVIKRLAGRMEGVQQLPEYCTSGLAWQRLNNNGTYLVQKGSP